jgi:hypothetical protein
MGSTTLLSQRGLRYKICAHIPRYARRPTSLSLNIIVSTRILLSAYHLLCPRDLTPSHRNRRQVASDASSDEHEHVQEQKAGGSVGQAR